MVTINPEGNGYKMRFSNPGSGMRGFSTTARDLDEVKAALDHYTGNEKTKGRAKCPLCRDIAARK